MRKPTDRRTVVAGLAVLGSQGLLAAGFGAAGRLDGTIGAAACALGWLAVLVWSVPAAGACLTASLALGVLSALAGAPGWLPAAAAGASLAAWDLTRLAAGARGADEAGERRIVTGRLGALAAGILPGLALAGLLGWIRLALPFAVMLALAIAALVALDRAARRWD